MKKKFQISFSGTIRVNNIQEIQKAMAVLAKKTVTIKMLVYN